MTRSRSKDNNQTEIVTALREMGAVVTITHTLGGGFPDIVVGFDQKTILVEIKDGSKPPSKRTLTPQEETWHRNWIGGPLVIIESVDDAVALLERMRKETV